MRWIKSVIFLLILAAIACPAVQKALNIVTSKRLDGYFEPSTRPEFSLASFKTGEFQAKMTPHLERTIGFHDDFTRLFNQCDFTFFTIPHAQRIVVGKNNYLIAETYILGYLGTDFVGKYYIEQKVKRARFLQDYLWKKKGILLVVVFAPGKGFFYPEYIPDRYLRNKKEVTNYGYFLRECNNQGVNNIDFNQWLITLKDTSRYLLYPKTGIHWSSYGAYLCADSLRKYLEVKMNRKLPHLVLDSIEVAAVARDEDYDIGRTLNLIWKIPHPLMAYPKFHFTYDSVMPKPKALFVGDSFYWYWHYNGIIGNTFSNTAFWYYNQDVYPEHFKTPTNTGNLNYPDSLLNQQVIILLQTNGAYGDLGYGWVDRAYDCLYPGPTREKEIEAKMRATPSWTETLARKAKDRGITTDAMSRLDAIYIANQEVKRIKKK